MQDVGPWNLNIFLLSRGSKYSYPCATFIMRCGIIHEGMEFDICAEDPNLHKSCPLHDGCSERSGSEKQSNYRTSACTRTPDTIQEDPVIWVAEKLKSMQGEQLGRNYVFSSLSWVYHTALQVLLLGTQITFPGPVTSASRQKQWSQEK